ncbi:MAG: hypothetical protein QMC80_09435, partial [Thermoplasmatales archaeon]|nr:hypothetical protein [Thermoplasmatales archaeon]
IGNSISIPSKTVTVFGLFKCWFQNAKHQLFYFFILPFSTTILYFPNNRKPNLYMIAKCYHHCDNMAETQVIFRVDDRILRRFDRFLKFSGFRTRNEWFRSKVREFLEDMEREKALKAVRKLTVKGMTEDEIVRMVKDWRKREH